MKVIAVCACLAGLMHTFMAAKALQKEAKKRDFDIKIETQSAAEIENELSPQDVSDADFVVLSIDTAIQGMNRFDGKVVIQVNTTETLKNTRIIFENAIERLEEL